MEKIDLAPKPLVERERQEKERLINAGKFFDDFLELRPGEKVLFITDSDPLNTDRKLINLLENELNRRGTEFREVIADKNTQTAEIAALLADHKVVWASCDWDSTGIDFYELTEILLPETESRMEDAAGLEADSLDNNGFLAERRKVLEARMGKMLARLKETAGLHINTNYGTDLWLKMRPDRRWVGTCGLIDPGEWDNPGAEVFTTPDEEGIMAS